LRRTLFALGATLALALAVTAAALAGKTPSGSSTGTGSVFVPNPVSSLGDESLTDQKDSDAAVPSSAYYDVALTNLDGSGFLQGDFANV
jgi:zinc metalloprotease ZmpB